jgi:2-isopropylmalate synthase
VRLTDYKVRVLDPRRARRPRCACWSSGPTTSELGDGRRFGQRDRSELEALVDAIRLELMRLTEKDESIEKAVEDYCWGV